MLPNSVCSMIMNDIIFYFLPEWIAKGNVRNLLWNLRIILMGKGLRWGVEREATFTLSGVDTVGLGEDADCSFQA